MKNLFKLASVRNSTEIIFKFETLNDDVPNKVDVSKDLKELGQNIENIDPIFKLEFSKKQVKKIVDYIEENPNAKERGKNGELEGVFMTTLEEFGNIEIKTRINGGEKMLYVVTDDKSPDNYSSFDISIETGKLYSTNVQDKEGASRVNRIKNAFNEILEKVERGDEI